MLSNYKNIVKIFAVLVFALLISSFSVKNIFLANSPKIRPNLVNHMMAQINNTKDAILARLNFKLPTGTSNSVGTVAQNQENDGAVEFLKKSLQPITKGVSAATQDGYSYTEIRLNEVEWAQITYTLKNGQTITIQYPKGTEPPPQAIYDGETEQ